LTQVIIRRAVRSRQGGCQTLAVPLQTLVLVQPASHGKQVVPWVLCIELLFGSGTHELNRVDLQQLADDRVLDASFLLDAGRWSGAYYLAGYAVECALKACIAKRTNLHDFPDKTVALKSFTHDISELLYQAGLKLPLQLDTTPAANPGLGRNWQLVKDWSEKARYEQLTEVQARKLYQAITDSATGVLPWIKGHW
jgi:HEPN domain-containing protein